MVEIKIKKIKSTAKIPTYESEMAAGFDLYAADEVIVPPFQERTKIVPTGLKMAIPKGYELQIRPRSGMALKSHIIIANSPGTIDADYRGEVGILVRNTGATNYKIDIGDRIAQGVLSKVPQAGFAEVDTLSETSRGAGAYGSTGF